MDGSPSHSPVLIAGPPTGAGASAILRSSLGVVMASTPADDRAGALATFFTVRDAALSLPVLGLGVALKYLSPRVTLLVFALIVAVGILAAAPILLRRPATAPSTPQTPGAPVAPTRVFPGCERRAHTSTSSMHQPRALERTET